MKDLTTGNATRQIILFSLPMLIGNLFQQLYSMVDALVVGRYVSGTALAAVGVASNVLNFLLAVLIGLTTGASVIIAQFYGAKQYDKLERTVSTSIMFLTGFAVIVTVVGVTFAPNLLRLLNTDPIVIEDATLYLRTLISGMIFPVFFNMYTAYLRALGDSRTPLIFLICSAILDIGMNFYFVIGLGWGVMGVAVSTVIAQGLAAISCYLYTRRSVAMLRVDRLIFDKALFGSILKYGLPAALQLSLVTLANLSITRLVNSFGAAAMAGFTAVTKIDQMVTQPVSNLSMAISTFVAQNMGADLEDRARKGFRSALLFAVALAAAISAALIGLGPRIIALFLDPTEAGSAAILQMGLNYMNILVMFYFLFAFLFGFNGFFRGAGDAVIAMVFPVSSLVIRTISAYALVHFGGLGPEAVAWSIPIGWGLCSLASFVYYRKRLWAGKSITGVPIESIVATEP